MLTGSTHVDPITATSAYADMAYVRYILLTVAYMPRQQCKMLTKLIRILYLQQQFKFVGQLVLLSCVLCTKYIYYILRMHKVVFLIFSSTLNVYNFFVIYNFYNPFFLNERYASCLSFKKMFAQSGRIDLRPQPYIGIRR